MRRLWFPVLLAVACAKASPPLSAPTTGLTAPPPRGPMSPPARRADTTYTASGLTVPDPYAWLEDLDSEETTSWVTAENKYTRSVIDPMPERAAFQKRMTELWAFARWGSPVVAGTRWFYTFNDGTMDQPQLLVQDGPTGAATVLIDSKALSSDGTTSLAEWSPSEDGRYLAYSVSDGGSDWRVWRVRDVTTGQDLPDELKWVKFSGASWLPDGSGFFYGRFPEPASGAFEETLAYNKVYFHRVNTRQSDDVLIYEDPTQPEWGFGASVTEDGKRVFLSVSQGTEHKARIYYFDTATLKLGNKGGAAGGKLVKLLDGFDADYTVLTVVKDTAYLYTDKDAPRGRVVSIDLKKPAGLKTVIAESDATIEAPAYLGGRFVVSYLRDAHSEVVIFDRAGKRLSQVALPGLGSAEGFSGEGDERDAYFSFTSFTHPGTVYDLDTQTGLTKVVWQPKVPFSPDDFETVQVRYPSRDGTEIPMFLTYRKDLDRTKPQPTLLYGYGGFNIPITPAFRVDNLAWMEKGGVYAVANLRGGGEYGRDWHLAGCQFEKQNVFDDFIGAAEWLIAKGWTTKAQLGIHGRSNGGLLTGAVLTQRPDLFGAALPGVGVLDMMKYHTWTIGWAWASDYGTSADSPEMFKALAAYSPVHNTHPGVVYPPTLITTGDHDDRVVPAHSYKFAASLQHAQGGDAPVLIRIETRGGHGASTPVSMQIEEASDKFGFLAHYLGLKAE